MLVHLRVETVPREEELVDIELELCRVAETQATIPACAASNGAHARVLGEPLHVDVQPANAQRVGVAQQVVKLVDVDAVVVVGDDLVPPRRQRRPGVALRVNELARGVDDGRWQRQGVRAHQVPEERHRPGLVRRCGRVER